MRSLAFSFSSVLICLFPSPPPPYSLLFSPSLPLLFTLSSKVIIRDSCKDREICRASPPHHFQLTRMLHVKLFPLPRRCFPVCGSPATFIYHFLSLVFLPLSFPFSLFSFLFSNFTSHLSYSSSHLITFLSSSICL